MEENERPPPQDDARAGDVGLGLGRRRTRTTTDATIAERVRVVADVRRVRTRARAGNDVRNLRTPPTTGEGPRWFQGG